MSGRNRRLKTILAMACVLGAAVLIFLPKTTSGKYDTATDKQILNTQSSTGKIISSEETSELTSAAPKKDEAATTSLKKDDRKPQDLKPEIDPDDYDLEGYYEDNQDEYEDIDDAYDGFLDDEDAWEDY